MKLTGTKRLRHYLDKHALYEAQCQELPRSDLGLIVVVPCYNEPDITTTLASLWQCQRPASSVEILIVVNASSRAPSAAHEQNATTINEVNEWANTHNEARFCVRALHFPDLPTKHAGVGLARKVGLDEATYRAERSESSCILINLDADCEVDNNYLVAIEEAFADAPRSVSAACVYFEHPLEGELPPENYEAIAQYELHLRYFVQGMRVAKHPYDFHTVGSTIALTADSYARNGGMNKRRGGEDFYFLQKLAHNGDIININTTCIRPSSRLSDRNPFGTGPTLTKMVGEDADDNADQLSTYHPDAFAQLRTLTKWVDAFTTTGASLQFDEIFSPELAAFIAMNKGPLQIERISRNTKTQENFRNRFFHWFNGFQAVKWVHYFRDHGRPNVPVQEAALALLPVQLQQNLPDHTTQTLLQAYREIDRKDQRLGHW